jgi:hypothetical protein
MWNDTQSVTNPHKKNPKKQGGHAISTAQLIHRIGKWVLRYSLLHSNEGVRHLAGSEFALLDHLRLTVD